jgi:hypothetical protein
MILFPGTIEELNSCSKIKSQKKKFELAGIVHSTNIMRYNGLESLFDDIKNPRIMYKNLLFEDSYADVVRYSENFVVQGEKLVASYSGIPIKLKEKWWKKYFKEDKNDSRKLS